MGKPSNYAFLTGIPDLHTRSAMKAALDRLAVLERATGGIGEITKPLASDLDTSGNRITNLSAPSHDLDAVNLIYLKRFVEARMKGLTQGVTGGPTPVPLPTPTPTPTGICYTNLLLGQPTGVPAAPNLRWFRGDFCGVNVPGLPPVAGGSGDPSVLLTPFIDRYAPADQAHCFDAYRDRGYTHWKLWWPDSRDGAGQSEDQFVTTMQMVQANGFYPVPFLYAKGYDGVNPDPTKNDSLIGKMIAGGVAQIVCVGGELDLFNTPGPMFQALIDHVTGPLVAAGCHCYVHFSEGYVAWQAPGDLGSTFWIANMGKLTGILHQKKLTWDCPTYQARLADLQIRFGTGDSGWPADSGFGHPFDIVADEYSATGRFNQTMSETEAKAMGNQAICSPGRGGIPTPLPIMGYNNGGPVV